MTCTYISGKRDHNTEEQARKINPRIIFLLLYYDNLSDILNTYYLGMTKVGRMTFSLEQIQLQKHIEANFKELVSDPLHWARCDIFNIDQLLRYLDEEAYVCLHKSAYGFKPRHGLKHLSNSELRAEIDKMSLIIELEIAEEKAEQAAKEDRIKPRYRCNQCHTPELTKESLGSCS